MTRLLSSAQSENERTLFRLLSDNVDPCFTRGLFTKFAQMSMYQVARKAPGLSVEHICGR